MNEKHISRLAARSRRIDLPASPTSLVVRVPAHITHAASLNEIARVAVDGVYVPFRHIDRDTAQLDSLPPPGAVVSLYWLHPGEWSEKVVAYLRDEETVEQFQDRLLKTHRDISSAPAIVYGLTPSSGIPRDPLA